MDSLVSKLVRSAAIAFLLLARCAAIQKERDWMYINAEGFGATDQKERDYIRLFRMKPGEWKIGHYSPDVPNQHVLTEFVREGDDIKNWRELFTVQMLSKSWGGPSPQDSLNGLKLTREKNCPGVTEWNVIAKDEKSILYEWQAKSCMGWPDQHEIARIIDGKYTRFRVAYTAKVNQLRPDDRALWIKRLSAEIKVETRETESRIRKTR